MAQRKGTAVIEPTAEEEDPLWDYDENYLACRSIAHRWEVTGFYHDRFGGVIRHVRCDRCGTTRRDIWTQNGVRVANSYSYAEGYQIKGSGGISRTDVRVATLKRVRVYDNEREMLATFFGQEHDDA